MRAVVALTFVLLAQFMGSPMSGPRSRTVPRSPDFLPAHNFKPEQVLVTFRKYHEAVLAYRHGQTAEAIAVVATLPRAQVEFIMEALRSERRGRPLTSANPADSLPAWMRSGERVFQWTRLDLLAAGLLHGDVALAKVDKADFEDELRLALSMLPVADLPFGGEPSATWTRDWLRATGGAMLAERAWGPLRVLLAYADLLFSDDGPLQLVRGTLNELQAESPAPPVALTFSEGPARARRDRDALRDEAIESLTRALKLMPDSDEAAVRLAHVRLTMHQTARAVPLLDRVVASERSDWWYFAALMRGDAYAVDADFAAAERQYRKVIDRFPRSQSPYVALATLLHANGRYEEAASTMDQMYERPSTGDTDDPWWEYSSNMGPRATAVLDGLRAAVRQ